MRGNKTTEEDRKKFSRLSGYKATIFLLRGKKQGVHKCSVPLCPNLAVDSWMQGNGSTERAAYQNKKQFHGCPIHSIWAGTKLDRYAIIGKTIYETS